MKRIIATILTLTLIMTFFVGCDKQDSTSYKGYEKYSYVFYDTFNTVTQVVGYAKNQKQFDQYAKIIHNRMKELHKLYDKYNDYEGINNIKTINDNAGKNPVKVNKDLLDLIIFSKDMHEKVSHKANIAMGSVLEIWHNYREEGLANPIEAKIPPMEELIEANKHTDLNKVVIDIENSTIYLEDPKMRLDVGAVAKGYATEKVAEEVMDEGFTSGIISAGGNIRALGKPMDGVRERWGIGLQDPDKMSLGGAESSLDIVFITDASVVSSGVYERFYVVDGKSYHHIIDPETLMPGEYYKAITVLIEDSGEADFLSTAVFLLPYEESRALVESLDGVEALWILNDNTIEATENFRKVMKSHGASDQMVKDK